jgi:glycerol-3-phosphate dehydrogenase (NAD(P)+)
LKGNTQMNSCVLGAGAWGTAIALHLMKCGHSVSLAPRRIEQAMQLTSSRENTEYLPGFSLPESLQIGYELEPILMEADVAFLACPAKGLRPICERIIKETKGHDHLKLIVILSKGFEKDSFKMPYEVVREYFPNTPVGILSGPSFASEVAAAGPTALSLAVEICSPSMEELQETISNDKLRVYLTDDLKGVGYGGILKNIYAIGAGLCDGLKLGDNAKSAYITRALNEMVSIGKSLGGRKETFYGLSGFGDLIATCFGEWSRNRTFGESLGMGIPLDEILDGQKTVVEGVVAVDCLYQIARRDDLETPILDELYAILYHKKSPELALNNLMVRHLKTEF